MLDLRLRGDDEALHTPHRIAGALRLPRKWGVFSPSGFLCKGAQVCPLPWREGVGGAGFWT
jgi:hypothetical protein